MVSWQNDHIECREGEVFFKNIITSGSMELKEFDLFKKEWSSARLGVNAYDENNNIIIGQRPVFIKFEQLVSRTPVTP